MKYLFLIIAVVLSALGIVTYFTYPNVTTDVPILYWVTDANPARKIQVAEFHNWLVENGHTTKDGKPVMELRLDSGNREQSKQIIQGVSGVGGDIMDCGTAGFETLQAIGLLEDVTEDAKRLGFSTEETYAAITPELTIRGEDGERRQYAFPCNVSSDMFWVNKATFKKYGIELPPKRWTFEEFEKLGKEFCEKANKGKARQDVFITSEMRAMPMFRSLGLSVFNETLTACTLDDPRYVKVLKLIDKWTNEDHILPSKAEMESFDTQSGFGGARFQLFNSGNYGLLACGRWALIGLRSFGVMDLGLVELPHGGYPNTIIGTRRATVYSGGKHKDLAKLFLAYLASDNYNKIIVEDADALPPSPAIAQTEGFIKPLKYRNEWGVHKPFSDVASEISIAMPSSPFVIGSEWNRSIFMQVENFDAKRCTAEEAAQRTAENINEQIQRTLREFPQLRDRYNKAIEVQKKIDAYRAEGKQVPESWVSNPFHYAYGKDKGWIKVGE